jgi:hypothetical protein
MVSNILAVDVDEERVKAKAKGNFASYCTLSPDDASNVSRLAIDI